MTVKLSVMCNGLSMSMSILVIGYFRQTDRDTSCNVCLCPYPMSISCNGLSMSIPYHVVYTNNLEMKVGGKSESIPNDQYYVRYV